MSLHHVFLSPSGSGHPRPGRAGYRRCAGALACALGVSLLAGDAAGQASREDGSASPDEPVVELRDYVITGTRTMQRIDASPVRTELVTAREFEAAGARSLADTVELLPGVRVENNCQNCGTSDLLLLGLDGRYTSVLFDGVPLFSGLAAVYGLDQIPSAFIDRLEVVKGGGSAVYGSGAVGGVVNIIARRPTAPGAVLELICDDVKGRANLQLTGIADCVSADQATAATVYGQIARVDPVDLNGDGFSDLTKRDLRVIGARVFRKVSEGEVRLEYTHTDEFRRGGNKFDLPDHLADISERVDTRRDAVSALWTAEVSPEVDIMVSGSAAFIDRESYYGGLFGHGADEPLTPESSPGAGDNDQAFVDRGYSTHGQVARDQFGFTENWVANLEAQANLRRGAHRASVGVQYYREAICDVVPVSAFVVGYPVERETATGDNAALFIQDDWHISEAWEVVFGLRADKNSELDHAVVSPRVNLKWAAGGELTLRAALGAGFRAPQPFDEDLHIVLIAGERAKTVQAADLREERSASALLSATWNPAFAAGRMTLEATGFLTRLDGTFTTSAVMADESTGEAFRVRDNGPDARVGGLEVNLGLLPRSDLRLDLGFVVQVAHHDEAVVLYEDAESVVAEADFLETPGHHGVAQLTYSPRDVGSFSLSATYTGEMKHINLRTGVLNESTESFVVWSATARRVIQLQGQSRLTLSVGVKNLLDARQGDLESGVDRDPYYLYGPRTPRTVFVGTRLDF